MKIVCYGPYNYGNNKECLNGERRFKCIVFPLIEAGHDVLLISRNCNMNTGGVKEEVVSNHLIVKYYSTFFPKNRIHRTLYRWLYYAKIFFFFLNLKKEDIVLIYHSVQTSTIVAIARRIAKFKLIMEVEEIYANVICNSKKRKKEEKAFRVADGFVFPTELLNEKVNRNSKPYVSMCCNGNAERVLAQPFADGKIHLVYAGTFNPRKGLTTAVAATEFLPENYHLHILGVGNDKSMALLQKAIDNVSIKTKCTVTYDGQLVGDEFTKFIQSCHIGLSPQVSGVQFTQYNESSFPSKVPMYLANGLRVVSVRLKALEQSGFNDLIYYYDDDDPALLAKAIRQIDITQPYDSRQRVRELNEDFKIQLKNLIENLQNLSNN